MNRTTMKAMLQARRGRAVRGLIALLHETRGTSAVEFGLLLPMLVGLLVPTADLGMGLYERMELQTAVQAGAEFAAAAGTTNFNAAAIQNAVTSASKLQNVSVTPVPAQSCGCATGTSISAVGCGTVCPNGQTAGSYVTVNASVTYTPIINYPVLGNAVTLTAQAVSRI